MDGQNLLKSLNSRNKNLQVDVQVITLQDNLYHPYFSFISLSKDNSSPIGVAVVEAPYTPYISHYWIKYQGEVVISFSMEDLQVPNTNSLDFFNYVNNLEKTKFYTKIKDEEKNEEKYVDMKQRIQNDEYNYSFICKVSRFKQKGNKFIIHFTDLGWKFLQKVPKEFRDTYIAGQYLDDAFQAMCEFMGIEFAYSIEDLHAYTFGTDGYSVQKDGQTIEDVSTVLSEWGPDTEEEKEEKDNEEDKVKELEDPMYENEEVIELDKKNEDNENYVKKTEEQNKIDNKTEEEDTKTAEEKIKKYQEEFDQKILDLFIGNTYYESNLVDPILDYGRITITPQVVSNNATAGSSAMSATGSNSSSGSGEITNAGVEEMVANMNSQAQPGVVLGGLNFIRKPKNIIGGPIGNLGGSGTSTK